MSGTFDEVKQLRHREEEVKDLRDEKQHHRLGKVSDDPHHGKGHASEVAVCIANKDTGRVPVQRQQSRGHRDERHDDVSREEVRSPAVTGQFDHIEHQYR